MRFSTTQPQAYCSIDRQARTRSRCLLHQDGELLRHRHRNTSPEILLKALAPSREALVVAVAGLLPWDWLAALGAQAQMPGVLGHALSMQAIHRGQANNAQSDAQQSAGRRRGGRRPQASGSPAEMRATRARRRRRLPLTRTRAARLAHRQHPPSPYPLPARGQPLASKANRAGAPRACPLRQCTSVGPSPSPGVTAMTSGSALWP
jgi:hypothetical protein